jgi:methylated-DNA-[protein]-cysteine S-methyltransferase
MIYPGVVRFDSIKSPVGLVFVAVSERGVCDVTLWEGSEREYRMQLAYWAPEVERDREPVATVLDQLAEYFSGTRRQFSVSIDLRRTTVFTSRVLNAVTQIPFGQVVSYGDIARRIGAVNASRAVGGALGRNPVPIIVPCHRVITWKGQLGGYAHGLRAKRALLQLEGQNLKATG